MKKFRQKSLAEYGWDLWCISSIIGIWPRFIEPHLLAVNHFTLFIDELPLELERVKILQFSDLHWSSQFSTLFAKKIIRKIRQLNPDLIVFTGDLLSRSQLEHCNQLRQFLNNLKAPYGCFAVLGNHDYDKFVTINQQGDYDIDHPSDISIVQKGFERLLKPLKLTKKITTEARTVQPHSDLTQLFEQTSIQLLKNETKQVFIKNRGLNICGLEEYTTGRLDVEQAFKNYDSRYPGVILSHNPDSIPLLLSYPGDVILSGHTHGGQVNLPFMWKKFTGMEHLEFKKGLKKRDRKWIYINRGLGSVMKFRWFSVPELTLFTLKSKVKT